VNDSREVLLNGVSVGSLVVTNRHGIQRYGKVIEIDSDANRSSRRGNVCVRHLNSSDSPVQWYLGCHVRLLTREICNQHSQELRNQLAELNKAEQLLPSDDNAEVPLFSYDPPLVYGVMPDVVDALAQLLDRIEADQQFTEGDYMKAANAIALAYGLFPPHAEIL
jgi:hypothetical protein